MLEVHLYGKLRRYVKEARASDQSIIRLDPQPDDSVRSVLTRIGIDPGDVCHVFLNGAIVFTRNSMKPYLRYQEGDREGLDSPVGSGDRLGLFAGDMALLVV